MNIRLRIIYRFILLIWFCRINLNFFFFLFIMIFKFLYPFNYFIHLFFTLLQLIKYNWYCFCYWYCFIIKPVLKMGFTPSLTSATSPRQPCYEYWMTWIINPNHIILFGQPYGTKCQKSGRASPFIIHFLLYIVCIMYMHNLHTFYK